MKNLKMYEANDKMISIISDNYNILQSLGSFGINLGFGDKTVQEVCEEQKVDTYTFLAVVNFTINGYLDRDGLDRLSIPTLLQYLTASHAYFIDFQLPFIRKELLEALDESNELAKLILQLYDDYAHSVINHMKYEERTAFPYVHSLLEGNPTADYNIETFSRHHNQIDQKLKELKNIIIKYLPSDGLHNNILSATLYDIYNNEEWLSQHARVEDNMFIPAIYNLELKSRNDDVSANISKMLHTNVGNNETLSDREKDVIVSLV
ncbi:MAG: hemerythrin domain-containing protein, partial [Prevotella sp.]